MNEFYNERHVTGRKPYRCEECHGGIYKGETSVILAGKNDGDFFSLRVCTDCSVLRKDAAQHIPHIYDPDDGVCFGDLYAAIKASDAPVEFKLRASVARERRRKIWELIQAGQTKDPAKEYTNAQPTEPGYYWRRGKNGKNDDDIVRVERTAEPEPRLWCDGMYKNEWPDVEWSGPLQPPK